MTTHLKINCVMRNNQWQKHQKVFETIKITKKLICPSGHRQNLLLKNEEGIYSYDEMCWQAKSCRHVRQPKRRTGDDSYTLSVFLYK